MHKSIKVVGTGVVTAIAAFLVLLLSGLGTIGYANSEGNWVSITTVNLGVNEFGLLLIFVVLVTAIVVGYAFEAADKK